MVATMKRHYLADLYESARDLVKRSINEASGPTPQARRQNCMAALGARMLGQGLVPEGRFGLTFDDDLLANGVLRLQLIEDRPLERGEATGAVEFKDGEVVEAELPPGS